MSFGNLPAVREWNTSVKWYQNLMGQYQLLTGVMEQTLARQWQQELVKPDELRDRAPVNTLVTANLRLVVDEAGKFQGRGVPLQDLISEGNIALINAAEAFKPIGLKFSTLAVVSIRRRLMQKIDEQCRNVRIPVNVHEDRSKVMKAVKEFAGRHNRVPSLDELMLALKKMKFKNGMTPEKLNKLMLAFQQEVSLSKTVGDSEKTISDFLPDTTFERADRILEKQEVRPRIESILMRLKPDQRRALLLSNRCGVDPETGEYDGLQRSNKTIGKLMGGVSGEWVRQLNRKAKYNLKTCMAVKRELRELLSVYN